MGQKRYKSKAKYRQRRRRQVRCLEREQLRAALTEAVNFIKDAGYTRTAERIAKPFDLSAGEP